MKNILLVNPWIYDFSAYNFGIKPLGLLRIGESLRRKGNKIYLIDCLDGCSKNKDKYGFSKFKKENVEKPDPIRNTKRPYFRYGISMNEFLAKLETLPDIDHVFVTSGMTYWYPGVQSAIKLLRQRFKNAKVILGGIYATLCHDHASLNSGADIVWKGDYLNKDYFYEPAFYPAFDLLQEKDMLPIQLTRGCPFRCSYCASRKLNPRFDIKDPLTLFEEVMHYHSRFGTKVFLFYDDALTYRSHLGIKNFLRMIIASGNNLTFYTPNGLHARFIDEELAELLKKSNFRDMRLSLETSDEDLQKFTGGKVTNDDLKRALRNLKEAGFSKNELGVYILTGSEWLEIERTLDDIMFINSVGAKAILASYSPIPGTKDYKRLIRRGVIKKDLDPLWHNKTIFCDILDPRYSENVQRIRHFASNINKLS